MTYSITFLLYQFTSIDLITMLTCIMIDRFGVIRDYLYDRDVNNEYFFGIPNGNKIEIYFLTSAEDLYEYLAKESEKLVN